ncbi:unnamed protein product [Calypogeia fissa]
MAGNIQNRSIFPAERHYMTLKGFVLNRACPEGSIAEGYVLHEAMEIWKYQNQQGDTTLSKLIGVEDSKEIDFDGQENIQEDLGEEEDKPDEGENALGEKDMP